MTSQQTTQTLAQRPTEYAFDLAHSSAEFSVKHLMIATVKGRMAITRAGFEVGVVATLAGLLVCR